MRKIALLMFLLAVPSLAHAQGTAVNPTTVEFQASPDHNSTWLDGSAIVAGYRIEYFLEGVDPTTGSPVMTVQAGKPTPDATNKVSVNSTQNGTLFAAPLGSGTVYKATVVAYGPSGTGRSAASNPFGFETRVAPAPASAVVVK